MPFCPFAETCKVVSPYRDLVSLVVSSVLLDAPGASMESHFWSLRGAIFGLLRALGAPGPLQGRSWASLGPPLGSLGGSWAARGALLAPPGRLLGRIREKITKTSGFYDSLTFFTVF